MGNKNTTSSLPPVMTNVEVRPRCVHRGCRSSSYSGFVMCVDHVKAAKQKEIDERDGKSKQTANGTVLQSSA